MSMAIPAVRPAVCSFRGADNEEKKDFKVADVSDKITRVSTEIDESVDALAGGMESITKGAGTIGTSAVGLWAIFKQPFVKMVNFFSKPVYENGVLKEVPVLDKEGKQVLNDAGEVVTKVLKKADWKKIGIAGGIVAAAITALALIKKAKNDKKVEAEKEPVENDAVTQEDANSHIDKTL